jgi:hypothetical protein
MLVSDRAIRWYVAMNVLFYRQTEIGLQETEGGIRTQVFSTSDVADIAYDDLRADLDRQIDNFTNAGSGWTSTVILRFVIRIGQFRPLVGSSFIPTLKSLEVKKALVNVYNPDDNTCFAWAVLSALYPSDEHSERLSKYRPHLQSINLTGLKFPLPINQVTKFEKMNPNISVNVYVYDEDEQDLIPKHVTKCGKRENHADLLLLSSKTNNNFHYVWTKRMSALVHSRTNHKGKVYVCPHCIHPFAQQR